MYTKTWTRERWVKFEKSSRHIKKFKGSKGIWSFSGTEILPGEDSETDLRCLDTYRLEGTNQFLSEERKNIHIMISKNMIQEVT